MRHPAVALVGFIVAIGLVAALVATVFDEVKPPPGAPAGERLYYRYCLPCHGRDGRGSWRATLFLIRPSDLSDPTRLRADSDAYLHELIKNGGSPLGKPGMPAFGYNLDDRQIGEVIGFVRALRR